MRIKLLLLMGALLLLTGCNGLDIQTGAEAEAMQIVAEAEAEAVQIVAEAEAEQLAIDREQTRQLNAIRASREAEAAAVDHQINLILDIAEAKARASVIQAFGIVGGIVGGILILGVFALGAWAVIYWIRRGGWHHEAPPEYRPGQYLSYRPGVGIQIVRQDGIVEYLGGRHV